MPAYGTQATPPALFFSYPNNQATVFSSEAVVAGEYSQQVQIPLNPTAGSRGVRVEVDFNSDPGNFEIDVMESDADSLGSLGYDQVPAGGGMTQANKTAGPNGANTRVATDLVPISGQFLCLYVKTAPSNASIKATARITRAV